MIISTRQPYLQRTKDNLSAIPPVGAKGRREEGEKEHSATQVFHQADLSSSGKRSDKS